MTSKNARRFQAEVWDYLNHLDKARRQVSEAFVELQGAERTAASWNTQAANDRLEEAQEKFEDAEQAVLDVVLKPPFFPSHGGVYTSVEPTHLWLGRELPGDE